MDKTTRFSGRAGIYGQFRPSYPSELMTYLKTKCNAGEGFTIADIGSGTGKWTGQFFSWGCPIFAVEPNADMRLKAEESFRGHEKVRSLEGTAEATGLPDNSVNLITAAQAFHWFDYAPTYNEFRRIARDECHYAIVWNDRISKGDPFSESYEKVLFDYCPEYANSRHRSPLEGYDSLFGGVPELKAYEYSQPLDLDGLKGRCFSSSYVPMERESEINAELESVFIRYQNSGRVQMKYVTRLAFGEIK